MAERNKLRFITSPKEFGEFVGIAKEDVLAELSKRVFMVGKRAEYEIIKAAEGQEEQYYFSQDAGFVLLVGCLQEYDVMTAFEPYTMMFYLNRTKKVFDPQKVKVFEPEEFFRTEGIIGVLPLTPGILYKFWKFANDHEKTSDGDKSEEQ